MAYKARAFLTAVVVLGSAQLAWSSLHWRGFENREFLLYFCVAALASLFPLKRVGNGISLSAPFVLLAIVDLTAPQAVLIGCTAVLIQFLLSTDRRPTWFRVLVGVAVQAMVIATAKFALDSVVPLSMNVLSVRVSVATVSLFVAATLPAAILVRLNEAERLGNIWKDSYAWSFPFYVVSGAMAIVAHRATAGISPEDAMLAFTAVFLAHRYYRNQRSALDSERKYASQMAALHIRAIEALALAVEAKDNLNTRGHLRRVQTYSLAAGRELGLDKSEIEALHAGALLHDIGKLAVPDQILTKPGKLTPEEFAKLKVHPLVGAEIVEQMQFPYPVAPIVREHHEKWNGSGYPFGLKGEEISIGARILAVVDCFDALTSDREYRKGIPIDEAMDYISGEAGKSFDPKVVEVLTGLYRSLDTQLGADSEPALSTNAKVEKGLAPDSGLDLSGANANGGDAPSFLSAIAAARREENLMWKLTSSVAVLEIREALPRIAHMVQGMIPYDALIFFVRYANALCVEFATGLKSEALAFLEVPVGEGVTGWVALRRQAIVNGNPSVDPGFPPDAADVLKSVLSVPLEGGHELIGALSLYRAGRDAFTGDELRILNAITPNIALALDNALKYRKSQERANVDSVTGLPGPDLFLQTVGEELARARRRKEDLCILFIEVNGLADVVERLGESRKDELLAAIGNRVKHTCREYDRIARMGPASFAVALPCMKPVYLPTILDRIERLGADVPDTISIAFGGAFYPEDGDGVRHLVAVGHRRAQTSNPTWTESVRALAQSVGRANGRVEEHAATPLER